MDTLGPGTIIGLPAALNGEYSATARAVEKSELGFIPTKTVMDMPERNSAHMHAAMKLLALEVAKMRDMIANAPDAKRVRVVEKLDASVSISRR